MQTVKPTSLKPFEQTRNRSHKNKRSRSQWARGFTSPSKEKKMHYTVKKSEIRSELNQQMAHFLAAGGNIETVCQGASAYTDGIPKAATFVINEPRKIRTSVNEATAALAARKTTQKSQHSASNTSRTLRNGPRVIYDDFGEPLRKIWD